MKRERNFMIQVNSILRSCRSKSLLCLLEIFATILISASCLPLMAQQPDQKRNSENSSAIQRQQAGQSELEKENLNYVAAAPAQIKKVSIKHRALLAERTRWLPRKQGEKGRVVTKEYLPDTAVFDRLTTDVAFRSVATRLVQRYGYLRPNFNPDSEMGKEQELLMKERVRHLVQVEAQEDAESNKPRKTETSETKNVPCDLNEDR